MKDVRGLHVVVTGVIVGESRRTAEAKLTGAGANVQSSVTSKTDLLITGEKVGKTKTDKAAALGVAVIPWEQLWSNGPAVDAEPSATDSLTAGAAALTVGRAMHGSPTPKAPVATIAPMLAKAAQEVPLGQGWLHEVKWDGFRCVATIRGGEVTMQSRSGKSDYESAYAAVRDELAKLPDCVIDGELIVVDADGVSTLETMKNRHGAQLVLFDVLEVGEADLRGESLENRRIWLEELVKVLGSPRVAISQAFDDGQALLDVVRERGLEGIVSKRRSSTYREGTRTDAWTKVKVRNAQEFVVLGWTPGDGALQGHVGAFLLGVYDDRVPEGLSRLVYVGKVGTGGTLEDWDGLHATLVERDGPAEQFDSATLVMSGTERATVVWVEPDAVVQVAFQRWTKDGRLWHPSWQAVRRDKDARDVRREG